jgi:hypothetical protein
VLLLVASSSAFPYASTQSWEAFVNSGTSWGTFTSQAAALGPFNTNIYWAAPFTVCSFGAHTYSVFSIANGCSSVSGWLTLTGTCTAGDTLSTDQLTCTAAGGGGGGTYTAPAPGASTTASGDNGSGLAAWLNTKINAVLSWFVSIISSVFVGLWTLLTDFFIFILDQLFDLVLYIVGGMSWDFGAFSPATYWAMLPADLISVLNLIGVPIALGMIVAALGIRFVLQLIPFVRWGS